MTKEQIKLLNELQSELYESAERVARYFVKLNKSYKYIDSWKLDENEVEGTGTETWAYGGYEDHYVYFDAKWLYATDEKLQKYVDSILEETEKKRLKELKEKKEQAKEKKYQEYLKLKKEFEDGVIK